MAKLYEYQAKEILKKAGISVPQGKICLSAEEAQTAAAELGCEVVLKAQIFSTGRASLGGIRFAASADEAFKHAKSLLGMKIKNCTVEKILVEEKLAIAQEFYAGIVVDDSLKQPVLLVSGTGGTGIEEIAEKHPDLVTRESLDVLKLPDIKTANGILKRVKIPEKLLGCLGEIIVKLCVVAKNCEVRSAEINPIVVTKSGNVMAADCRITVDDHAIFRHPEFGIEIAREFDRPPTELEKIAWKVESNDFRGTFYFIQLEQGYKRGERYVGFHGAGGGGSMMSMDALIRRNFKPANFCDTSGNPPASKIYRAARIILKQPNLDGYFGSGSGVASQEQFHSARGLVKAFNELNLGVPAVIRLGGNQEEKAMEIINTYTIDIGVPVECYGKDASPDFCVERLIKLVEESDPEKPAASQIKKCPQVLKPYEFKTLTGRVVFDHSKCAECESKICIRACVAGILKLKDRVPVLAISAEDARRGRCTECLACEVDCAVFGCRGGYVELPVPGLDEINL
jgi:succinyl-CoA synthetase beta subunit